MANGKSSEAQKQAQNVGTTSEIIDVDPTDQNNTQEKEPVPIEVTDDKPVDADVEITHNSEEKPGDQ